MQKKKRGKTGSFSIPMQQNRSEKIDYRTRSHRFRSVNQTKQNLILIFFSDPFHFIKFS